MHEAYQAFDEALKIRRDLARKNPAFYRTHVAETLYNLGVSFGRPPFP
jgi:hypothetical protein